MKNFIARLYDKKIDASGLAVFRVLYGIVLLCEVVQLFYFRHLVFDTIPYLEVSEIDFTIPLVLWMLIIFCIILGLFTRTATIINYVLSLVFFATITTYEYHMFYVYMGVNFLLIFTSISKTGSLDALRLKLKHSNTRVTYNPQRKTSVLNYYAFVFVGIALVYFDSIFQKTTSQIWLNGLGIWLPASMPQTTLLNQDIFFVHSQIISTILSYVTLFFEAILIFVFFRKKWRVPMLIVGVGLHVGILFVFPIPWFGLGVLALYILLIPISFWKKIKKIFTLKKIRLLFYYDEECPLCNRTKIIVSHLDFLGAVEFKGVQSYGFEDERLKNISKDELLDNIYSISHKNKVFNGIDTYKYAFKQIPLLFPLGILISIPGIYHLTGAVYKKVAENRHVERCTEENCGFIPADFPKQNDDIKIFKALRVKDLKVYSISFCIVLVCLLQLNCIYNSLLIESFKEEIGLSNSGLEKSILMFSAPLQKISKSFFGITSHGVFVDSHFDNYNHIVALEADLNNGEKIWLPIIDKNGNPCGYNYSFIWAKWSFRVTNPNIDQEKMVKGIRDFTAFWAHKNGIGLKNVKFLVKVKKVDIPKHWEENFLEKQIAKPWISGGYVEWKNEKFYPSVKVIEKL